MSESDTTAHAEIIGEAEAKIDYSGDYHPVGDVFCHPQSADPNKEEWVEMVNALVELVQEARESE
jgi:hypothetical protein